MTNAQEQDEFKAAKSQRQGTETKPVSGVTAETFWQLGKAFMVAQGHGYALIRDNAWATSAMPVTVCEWGAWMGYFESKRIPKLVFERQGKGTVPARWPHLFDADWWALNDTCAADLYEAKIERENRSAASLVNSAARKTFVTNRLGYDPSKVRGVARFADEPEKQPRFIDKDLLLECYEHDMAALKAKEEARRRA